MTMAEEASEAVETAEAQAPVVDDGAVGGVRVSRRGEGEVGLMRAPVTVDATGWRGLLRHRVPAGWPIAEVVPDHETAIAYREERRRQVPKGDLLVEATFDFAIAPRGLYWYADRSETLVNVGIGMQRRPGLPSPRRAIRDRVSASTNFLNRPMMIRLPPATRSSANVSEISRRLAVNWSALAMGPATKAGKKTR